MGKKKAFSWVNGKLAEAKEKQREYLKSKGYNTAYTFPEGETGIHVLANEPREVQTKNGDRLVLSIKLNKTGELFDWMLNPSGVIYRMVLERLANGEQDMTIIRAGTGRTTRYSIKETEQAESEPEQE